MKLFKGLSLAISVWGALLLIPSCGGSSTSDGTDSNTHWLEECEHDSDCGFPQLSCVCGVCSVPCSNSSECQRFDEGARCENAASCGPQFSQTLCVAYDTEINGEGGSGGGAGGTGQTSPDPECPAMDAHTGTLACGDIVGYAFDGKICAPVACSCEGSECDSMFETADECDSAYQFCYAKHDVERLCTSHSDCAWRYRTCCPPCSGTSVDSVVGTTRSSPFLEDIGMCVGDPDPDRECGKCTPVPNPALYGACLSRECRPIDVSPQAECQTDLDCKLVHMDCCECTGSLMAVSVDTTSLPYCPADDCQLCPYQPDQQYGSFCNTDVGKCQLIVTTL